MTSASTPTSLQPGRFSKRQQVLVLSLFGLGLLTLVTAILLPIGPTKPRQPGEDTEIRFALPDFSLTERSGATITKKDLLGQVWVAGFVFTRCTGPCPSVSATMARLQKDLNLSQQDQLRLVTFTVDPGRDDLAELKRYADNFQADPQRWLFLRGEENEIHTLMQQGFKLGVKRASLAQPVEGQEFDHSTLLAVVDKQGVTRGYYDGYQGPNDEGGMKYQERYQEMLQMISRLVKE